VGVKFLLPTIIRLAFGALIGAILGGVITGDENYVVWIAVGVPVLITVVAIVVSTAAGRQRKNSTVAGRPGINETMTGAPQTPQKEAVLNPVSTVQPSAGIVLNGELVGAPAGSSSTGAMPATSGAGRGLRRVLGILTVAAGAALVLIPTYPTIAWIGQDVAAGHPFDGRDMRTGLHQQEAFDQVAALIGSTEVTSIYFFNDSIAVTAPTGPGARSVDRWTFQYGRASHDGPDYSQPDDIRDELFDAADIDMSLVAKLTRESLADADIADVDSIYPSITRFASDEPEISISISGAYFDAYYDYSITGELIQRSGSAFE
jgi:hypothetical protein